MEAARLMVTAAAWLLPAGVLLAVRRGRPELYPLYPAGLAMAGAVTSALIADELRRRAGDDMYESALAALRDHRKAQELARARHAREARKEGERPVVAGLPRRLRLAGRLAGSAAVRPAIEAL